MQCYTELLPPTSVTHAVALPLLSADANNLAVAKTSLLQLFSVASNASGDERLSLIGEYPLAGTVTSLARIKILESKSGGEALLVAFKDAKLSLIEWDPENHRISTISLHFYEGENVVVPPFGPSLADCPSILTVDPGSRCAALKFGARRLAILPFRQFGDDLAGEEEEDGFENEPTSPTMKTRESAQKDANGDEEQTPYKASFVLPLTALDPSLSHTVHLAFLHEYREPTLGLLSAPVEPSNALLEERKDALTYTVFTLDLEQRASTNLITVPKLPSTLYKVITLPLPIGGALLIGTNELVHVDQSGKANATAVNEFAKLESDFGMADQSHLNLKLEDCAIETLDAKTGELLLVTRDGSLATLFFEMSGRSISAINVTRVTEQNGGSAARAAPSCLTRIDSSKVFVGSEDGASSLLGWSKPTPTLSRKRSHAQMLGKDVDEEDEESIEEEDDDDLYDAAPVTKKRATSDTGANASDLAYQFSVRDQLHSLGPINDVCLGRHGETKGKLQLAASTGKMRSSRLAFLNRDIVPAGGRRCAFGNAKSAWAISAKSKEADASDGDFDNLLFIYDGENSKVFDISSTDEPFGEDRYVERTGTEFEEEGETLEVSTLNDGQIVVHCRRQEIRTYDSRLALDQIIPMVDEETDTEFDIVHISVCDPYLLAIRNDSSVQVLTVQGREVESLEVQGAITEKKWLSGCIYSGELTAGIPSLFLLSAEGGMQVFSLPKLQPVYALPNLSHLPPVISADAAQRRAAGKDTLTELLVADLGQDGLTRPYLVLRTAIDDVVLYEPFMYPSPTKSDPWHTNLRFRKVPVLYIPKYNETLADSQQSRPVPLKTINIGGYSAIAIPGASPCLLLKETSSSPKVLEVRQSTEPNGISSLAPLHRAGCEHGFLTIDSEGELQEFVLPGSTWYSTGWSARQTNLGDEVCEVRDVAFYEPRNVYIVATCRNVDFFFAEEDGRHPDQDDISLRPQVPQYSVHMVSSTSHRILHTIEMPYLETVTALKVMKLEVSENTHAQKDMVVVSTAAQRGEDMPAKGAIYVYDIIDVVPEPDVPESDFKLHRLAREENRGAITALAGPFPGGFIGTAQGLKIMIRGLKEDGSCLPVAFIDALTYTHTLKTLPGRGMWLAGDAWKGVCFGGFTEEPYKLRVLGKAPKTKLEVMTAEFLPFDGALFILAMDADMDLHVLQYDPENPKTVNGMRLLHRSTFHMGHFVTKSLLLPSTLAPFEKQDQAIANGTTNGDQPPDSTQTPAQPLSHVLTTSTSGSVGLITPLDESSYRRLSALQTHLTSILEHAAGLNPRAYRTIESEARGIVDGGLVRRIVELGAGRRGDVLARAGADVWGLRSDLEIVGGGGLGWL